VTYIYANGFLAGGSSCSPRFPVKEVLLRQFLQLHCGGKQIVINHSLITEAIITSFMKVSPQKKTSPNQKTHNSAQSKMRNEKILPDKK
jgi:hypothetical protein